MVLSHIIIKSNEDLNDFLFNVSSLFESDVLGGNNEVWVISSSVIECWRCRIYLSHSGDDIIEMAYSYDDHILDHIDFNGNVPYICYKINGEYLDICKTNLDKNGIKETNYIACDIFNKYSDVIKDVVYDLDFLNIDGICFDVRINNGYDFHDFDVSFDDTKKIIDYYMNRMKWCKKL